MNLETVNPQPKCIACTRDGAIDRVLLFLPKQKLHHLVKLQPSTAQKCFLLSNGEKYRLPKPGKTQVTDRLPMHYMGFRLVYLRPSAGSMFEILAE